MDSLDEYNLKKFRKADTASMADYEVYQEEQFRKADRQSMNIGKTSWAGMSESQLASYQTTQVGNNCAPNAIAAAFNLLGEPLNIDGNKLGDKISSMGIKYRLLPDSATMPFNQVNVINDISKITGQKDITLSAKKLNIQHLSDANAYLSDDDSIILYTVYWTSLNSPKIISGSGLNNLSDKKLIDGHTMVYIAYDPTHVSNGGVGTPYGFLNWWDDTTLIPAKKLTWMSEDDVNGFKFDVVLVTKK
jgi:hypothetical protein